MPTEPPGAEAFYGRFRTVYSAGHQCRETNSLLHCCAGFSKVASSSALRPFADQVISVVNVFKGLKKACPVGLFMVNEDNVGMFQN